MDDAGDIRMIDQRVLPGKLAFVRAHKLAQVADAIKDMTVRGAPAIGATAAFGVALAARQGLDLDEASRTLKATRPTANDLAFAVDHTVAKIRAGEDPRAAADAY